MEEDSSNRKYDSEKENPYQSMIINDFQKISVNINTLEMEQWSILSNDINCAMINRNSMDYYIL